jgi:hypothetical protein
MLPFFLCGYIPPKTLVDIVKEKERRREKKHERETIKYLSSVLSITIFHSKNCILSNL